MPSSVHLIHAKWCRLGAISAQLSGQESLPAPVRNAWAVSLGQVTEILRVAEKALCEVAFSTGPEEDKNYEAVMADAELAINRFDEIVVPAQKLIIKKRRGADSAEEKPKRRKRSKKEVVE